MEYSSSYLTGVFAGCLTLLLGMAILLLVSRFLLSVKRPKEDSRRFRRFLNIELKGTGSDIISLTRLSKLKQYSKKKKKDGNT